MYNYTTDYRERVEVELYMMAECTSFATRTSIGSASGSVAVLPERIDASAWRMLMKIPKTSIATIDMFKRTGKENQFM